MIKRSIAKAVGDYENLTGKNDTFYFGDIKQVEDLATDPSGSIDLHRAVQLALEAGYMIGYRTAKRHQRKRGKAV